MNAIDKTPAFVREQHDRTPRETCDVARASRTGKPHRLTRVIAPGGVEISKTIDFGGSEKADIDAALLEKSHHVKHRTGKRRAAQIWRIGHRVEQLGCRCFANHTIFKKADRIWGVGAFGDRKGDERQTHADENNFEVVDLSRRRSHH